MAYSKAMYSNLCYEFRLPKLENRRKFLDTLFLFKILHSVYNVPDVLAQIHFNVPAFTLRRTVLFRPVSARTNILKHSFLSRSQTYFNSISNKRNLDIFNNFSNFRHELCKILFLSEWLLLSGCISVCLSRCCCFLFMWNLLLSVFIVTVIFILFLYYIFIVLFSNEHVIRATCWFEIK